MKLSTDFSSLQRNRNVSADEGRRKITINNFHSLSWNFLCLAWAWKTELRKRKFHFHKLLSASTCPFPRRGILSAGHIWVLLCPWWAQQKQHWFVPNEKYLIWGPVPLARGNVPISPVINFSVLSRVFDGTDCRRGVFPAIIIQSSQSVYQEQLKFREKIGFIFLAFLAIISLTRLAAAQHSWEDAGWGWTQTW